MIQSGGHDVGLQMVGHLHGQRQRQGRGQEAGAARQEVVVDVVGAARAEHEPLHAHAQRCAFRLDALPHEHAATLQSFHLTRFRADLIRYPSADPSADPATDASASSSSITC